jgi:hypothetical protein
MAGLVHGWGINDLIGTYHCKFSLCPIYKTWKKMIGRCYDPKYHETRPTYVGCTVTEEWRKLSSFKAWMELQNYHGMSLDKDILVAGNTEYNPKTCTFVPKAINSFFTFIKKGGGNLPYGVSWCESENCYKAYCANLDGKNKTLGRFKMSEEASIAYKKFKNSLARKLAKQYEGLIDNRVTEALYNFDVTNY